MAEVISIRESVAQSILIDDRSCVICGAKVESYFHLLKECQCVRTLAFASKWGCALENWRASFMEELIQ